MVTTKSQDLAQRLGISHEAAELYLTSDVIDLHLDGFIWPRVFGYDLTRSHPPGRFGRWFFGHADVPSVVAAGINGATWVITTNPFRPPRERAQAFADNLADLAATFRSLPQLSLVKTYTEYQAAQALGKHAAFIGVQGGNAVDYDVELLESAGPQQILRVTLIHLTPSALGHTSLPWFFRSQGLTSKGREFVEALNAKRIFVDLAHINRQGFFDALEVQDKSQPVLVTHTGVSGVFKHWRNLDDEQIRAIAATGGVIGLMYHSSYLGGGLFGASAESVVRHIEHVVNVVGDDHAALGSDWDGAIVPPSDLGNCSDLPRLVDLMLQRGLKPASVQKILGLNFLRVLRQLRG